MAASGRDVKTLEVQLTRLKAELVETRGRQLAASRAGDFMRVARLDAAVKGINRSIFETENELYALIGNR
jgi:hypothetical protein